MPETPSVSPDNPFPELTSPDPSDKLSIAFQKKILPFLQQPPSHRPFDQEYIDPSNYKLSPTDLPTFLTKIGSPITSEQISEILSQKVTEKTLCACKKNTFPTEWARPGFQQVKRSDNLNLQTDRKAGVVIPTQDPNIHIFLDGDPAAEYFNGFTLTFIKANPNYGNI